MSDIDPGVKYTDLHGGYIDHGVGCIDLGRLHWPCVSYIDLGVGYNDPCVSYIGLGVGYIDPV